MAFWSLYPNLRLLTTNRISQNHIGNDTVDLLGSANGHCQCPMYPLCILYVSLLMGGSDWSLIFKNWGNVIKMPWMRRSDPMDHQYNVDDSYVKWMWSWVQYYPFVIVWLTKLFTSLLILTLFALLFPAIYLILFILSQWMFILLPWFFSKAYPL